MINAPYEKEFVFHDGKRAKNILELSELLDRISLEEFSSFVNTDKNDFANWVEYVLNDRLLSEKLRTTTNYDQTRKFLRIRLQENISQDQAMYETARNAVSGNISDNFVSGGVSPDSSNKESEFLLSQNISDEKITFLDRFFRKNKHGIKHDMKQHNTVPENQRPIQKDHALEEHHISLLQQPPEQHIGQTTQSIPDNMYRSDIHGSNQKIPAKMEAKKEDNKETVNKENMKNKWFEFFGKKSLSKNSLEHTADAETEKHLPEKQLKEEMHENTTENWFCVILYGVLIGLIIILLLYKFVLAK